MLLYLSRKYHPWPVVPRHDSNNILQRPVNFNPQSPAKALLPAFHIRNVERSRLDRFKSEPVRLPGRLGHSAGELEEYLKNIVADFLKKGCTIFGVRIKRMVW